MTFPDINPRTLSEVKRSLTGKSLFYQGFASHSASLIFIGRRSAELATPSLRLGVRTHLPLCLQCLHIEPISSKTSAVLISLCLSSLSCLACVHCIEFAPRGRALTSITCLATSSSVSVIFNLTLDSLKQTLTALLN